MLDGTVTSVSPANGHFPKNRFLALILWWRHVPLSSEIIFDILDCYCNKKIFKPPPRIQQGRDKLFLQLCSNVVLYFFSYIGLYFIRSLILGFKPFLSNKISNRGTNMIKQPKVCNSYVGEKEREKRYPQFRRSFICTVALECTYICT